MRSAPIADAYWRSTAGVSRVGSIETDTNRTRSCSALGSACWTVVSALVCIGQLTGQCVKMKFITTVRPFRWSNEKRFPSWSSSDASPVGLVIPDGDGPRVVVHQRAVEPTTRNTATAPTTIFIAGTV